MALLIIQLPQWLFLLSVWLGNKCKAPTVDAMDVWSSQKEIDKVGLWLSFCLTSTVKGFMGTNPPRSVVLPFLLPSQSLAWRGCEMVGDSTIVTSMWGLLWDKDSTTRIALREIDQTASSEISNLSQKMKGRALFFLLSYRAKLFCCTANPVLGHDLWPEETWATQTFLMTAVLPILGCLYPLEMQIGR